MKPALRRQLCLLPAALSLIAAPRAVPGADARAWAAAVESVRVDDLRNHVSALASDTFEGREAGSRGGRAAGAYLIDHLQRRGIAPGGSERGYEQQFGSDYRNILAVLPGGDERLSNEFVVVGAHYDHVGFGRYDNSQGPVGYIHNGADDNASGTAGLLEAIDALAGLDPPPRRSILFAFWDAEEKGLLGSQHWVRNPTVPLHRVKLSINVDMIGRLRDDTLEVFGVRTARGLRRFISEQNAETSFTLDFNWSLIRDSDHYSFYERQIPFLMLHTRKHNDYHRPSDDVDRLNFDGLQQVSRLLLQSAWSAAEADDLPPFRAEAGHDNEFEKRVLDAPATAMRSRLGVKWDAELAEQGVIKVARVQSGSPAEEAGLMAGDRIVQFDSARPDDSVEFREVVLAAPRDVAVVVERPGEATPQRISVTLDGEPVRLGISWRVDPAEPETVIVSRVVDGSPADRAGLRVADRLHTVDGQAFHSIARLHELLNGATKSATLRYERRGRMHTARVDLLRAADDAP